jgi:cytochrome c-type biogenesis protein
VLASILAIASTSSVFKGAFLLAVYSAGLGLAFLLVAVAFTRAMGAFRWLRDHYMVIRVVGGLCLVALGLLLFFHRDWWLNVFLNRLLEDVGLGNV